MQYLQILTSLLFGVHKNIKFTLYLYFMLHNIHSEYAQPQIIYKLNKFDVFYNT